MARAVFLLPAGDTFGGQSLGTESARALGRADSGREEPGGRAQLRRHFRLVPDHWPLAALTRQRDAGDAAGALWLRADPAHLRPDINGARLLGCGDALQLGRDDADAFLSALRPLFGDAGFTIDAPAPGHWYLRLPREARLPAFPEPATALGEDVFDHLPDGESGRRWRALSSEAQVVLHNHPRNAERAGQGLPAVNALWFWGAGLLPDSTSCRHSRVLGDDEVLRALAHDAAGTGDLPSTFTVDDADALYDLRASRDLHRLQAAWLLPALYALHAGRLETIELDLADGQLFRLARRQHWRLWRRPLARFA